MTPVGFRTPGEGDEEVGYFDDLGPDFVDEEEEGEEKGEGEDEVKKLVVGRMGGWVDWAVGWMDFREDEDHSDGMSEVHDESISITSLEERSKHEQVLLQSVPTMKDNAEVPPAPVKADSIFSDAAWLLGVARSSLI
jgi:hypothetical protein